MKDNHDVEHSAAGRHAARLIECNDISVFESPVRVMSWRPTSVNDCCVRVLKSCVKSPCDNELPHMCESVTAGLKILWRNVHLD